LLLLGLLSVRMDAQSCGGIPGAENTHYAPGTCDPASNADGVICTLGCAPGYVPNGDLSVTCTAGAWIGPNAGSCVLPTQPSACDPGWSLSGQKMEGAFNAYYGYWLNFGFHYKCDKAATITWQASACWDFTCPAGVQPLQPSPFCHNNFQITLSSAAGSYKVTDSYGNTYDLSNQNIWLPGFADQLPCLCGGSCTTAGTGNIIKSGKGASFSLVPLAVNTTTSCVPQFHYRVPGAKSNTNANLATYCATNNNAAVCGASWSATPSKHTLGQCSQGAQIATSPGAIAGYTIAGIIVIGLLVLAIYWNLRSTTKGGHHRTPSNIKDEEVDMNETRPAAPSGSSPNDVNVQVSIQTS